MAMEGEDAVVNTRRLRARPAKATHSLLDKNEEEEEEEEEERPLGSRISSSLKRKANITVEKLYLQGNYKDPQPTPLETIFESPRPSRSQRGDSPDVPPLMARRKLKRLCVFGSHYQPTRSKLKQRKDRALRMRQLTGVRVPLGKTFSEDDVLAALSCLTEEEAATCLSQDTEGDVLDFLHSPVSNALVEKVTSVLSSLQMDCEPSLAFPSQVPQEIAPAQPCLSREQRRKRRSGLVVSPSSPLTSGSSDHPAQPSLAREKRLKRRSGLVFVEKTSGPLIHAASPQGASGDCPPQPSLSKSLGSQRKRHKPFPEPDQGTTAPRAPRVRPGNKRTPDSSPATLKKKQRTPSTSTQAPAAPPSSRGKARGKSKGKRRVSGVERSLYHHSILATDSPNCTLTPNNTPSPTTIPETPPPPPLTPNKRDCSPKLPDSPKFEKGDKEEPSGEGSPTSPSTRMAALSLHASPSPLPKPRKVRRRSARLSFGSEGREELRKTKDNDLPLGTFWVAHSPMEQKAEGMRAAQGGGGDDGGDKDDDDPPPPPPSITFTRKKKHSKGRRRSNLFLPKPEIMEIEPTATIPTFSITPSCPTQPPPPHPEAVVDPFTSLHHPITLLNNPTPPTLITTPLTGDMTLPDDPQVAGDGGKETGPQGMGKEVMGANIISPYSSSEGSVAPSPSPSEIKNTAFCEPLEGCSDLSTPSPTPATPTPSPTPAVTPATAPSTTPAFTPSPGQSPATLTPSLEQPTTPALALSLGRPSATLTSSSGQPSATLNPSSGQPPTITVTPSPRQPPDTLAPSLRQPLATLTPSPGQPPDSLTPGVSRGYLSTSLEEDWDSPIITGILTNETLIRMGQVYYGAPLTAPSSASV